MEEIWVVIEDWPNYEVSNRGQIFSIPRNRVLKISLNDGYPHVNLNNGDFWRFLPVHRLVAFAFVDGWFEGAVVNHKDGIKTNNYAENLEWVTHGEKMRHAASMGLHRGRGRAKRGETIEEHLKRFT